MSTPIDDFKAKLKDASTTMDAADAVAPPDIASDWHTARATIDQATAEVASLSDTGAALQALGGLDSSAGRAAASAIDSYTQDHCGFTLSLH